MEYAKKLHLLGYLPSPISCTCNDDTFTIQNDGTNKTSICSSGAQTINEGKNKL